MSADDTADAGWRTWPNLITVIRLATLGATDWIDGFVARRWHQVSNVGKILDPVADRVLVISGLLAVAAAAGVPWWFALTTLARELIVSGLPVVLAALGAARIDVLWWGKVSTFALMTTFPLFLLTTNPHHGALRPWQHDARAACWVIGIMGLTLSWIVLAAYVKPALRALRTGRQARQIL